MAKTPEGLHVVIDTQTEPIILDEIIAAEPAVIQVREKGDSQEVQERIADFASDLRRKLYGTDTLLAVNDHALLGIKIGADIIHIGQDDMPAEELVHYLFPGMGFGVSVQDKAQARRAEKSGAWYVGLPVWPSLQTKLDVRPEGLEGVASVSRAISIPLVGIGGIRRDNAHLVMQHGARGLAVAGEVTRSPEPRISALALKGTIYQYSKR